MRTGRALLLLAALLASATAAHAADRDADRGAPLPAPTPSGGPVRGVVELARVIRAADLAAVGVRRLEARPGETLSAEGAESEETEAWEEAHLRAQFPPGGGDGREPAPAKVGESVQAFGYAWAPTLTFNGPTSTGWSPADPNVAAGPNHLVLVVNTQVQFTDKSGNVLYADSLGGLVGTPANFRTQFDPKVVYDEGAGRFYLVSLTYDPAANISQFRLAVSMGSDPMQGWYVWAIRADQGLLAVDYENLGFGARGLYVSANYVAGFLNGPPTEAHANGLWTFDKASLLAGGAATFYRQLDLTEPENLRPTTLRISTTVGTPPAGLDAVLVGGQVRSSNATLYWVDLWGVTLPPNFPASGPTLAFTDASTAFPGYPVVAAQPGGPIGLRAEKVGANLLDCALRANRLTTTATLGTSGVSYSRAIGLDLAAWPTVSVSWVGELFSGGNSYFFPGVAQNAFGDVAMSTAFSGPSTFAAMRGAIRARDAAGFYPDFLVQPGTAAYTVNPETVSPGVQAARWGDYSGAAVDPVSQGFWLFHMVATAVTGGGNTWGTAVSFVPRPVFVDGASPTFETGSREHPWHSLVSGHADARPGNDLVVRAGTYPAGVTFTTPMRVVPDGGVVQIGP